MNNPKIFISSKESDLAGNQEVATMATRQKFKCLIISDMHTPIFF